MLCLVVMQVRDLLSYSQWYTDEDQTLLWFAGRELEHLRLHSPNFLGQNYNTVYEALPGALVHSILGVTLRLAVPLAAAVMVSLCWLLPAIAAIRNGHRISAALAIATPVCLALSYLLLYDQSRGVLTGDLLAAMAVSAAVGVRRPLLRLWLVILLGGVGFAWDNASIIAVMPAGLGAMSGDFRLLLERPRRVLVVTATALVVPAAALLVNRLWYSDRPGYLVTPRVDTSLGLSTLWLNLTHPSHLLGFYTPELLRGGRGVLVIVALVALICVAIIVGRRARQLEPIIAALGFGFALLAVLSVADTSWNFLPGLYLNGARFLLMMPIGVWAVAHFTIAAAGKPATRPWPVPIGSLRPSTLAVTVIAVLTVASTAVAQVGFRDQVHRYVTEVGQAGQGVQTQSSVQLLADCQAVSAIYRQSHAQILVSLDQPFAYGCAADVGINTLFPPYDRRPWLVRNAFTREVTHILLWGGINCQAPPLKPGVGVCHPMALGAELLVTPPRSPAVTLARMGVSVYRPPE